MQERTASYRISSFSEFVFGKMTSKFYKLNLCTSTAFSRMLSLEKWQMWYMKMVYPRENGYATKVPCIKMPDTQSGEFLASLANILHILHILKSTGFLDPSLG